MKIARTVGVSTTMSRSASPETRGSGESGPVGRRRLGLRRRDFGTRRGRLGGTLRRGALPSPPAEEAGGSGRPPEPGTTGRRPAEPAFPSVEGDGVMPAGTEGMTARQPPDCQGPALRDAVPLDRLRGIGRTAREEPAGSAEKWGQEDLIAPDTCKDEAAVRRSSESTGQERVVPAWRRRAVRKSSVSAAREASNSSSLGMTTRSTPAVGLFLRKTSRIKRLARLRRTAPPSRLEALTPSLALPVPFGSEISVRKRPWVRKPLF